MYTVIHAVHSLLYIVAKYYFFSVVIRKYIIKYLQKCEECTHFCEILYILLISVLTVFLILILSNPSMSNSKSCPT